MENKEQDQGKCESKCNMSKAICGSLLLLLVGGIGGYFIGRCGMGGTICPFFGTKPAAVAPATSQVPTDPAAMMAKMQEYATPGVHHKRLEAFIGKWTHTVEFRMNPEDEIQKSQGTNENRWILGGRFMYQDHKGQMMGQPFEGIGITGYDNIRGEYTSAWIDNVSTSMMTATAQYDDASSSLNESGTFSCPLTGEKMKSFRAVWKIVDNDHYTYEMYSDDKTGKEFRSMEIQYNRAK